MVLGIAFWGFFFLKPDNQYQHTYEDGTIIRLNGATFGTHNVLEVTTPWQRLTKSATKLWDKIHGVGANKSRTLLTNGSGMVLSQIVSQRKPRLCCYFDIENPESAQTTKKWFSFNNPKVVDAGGCVYKGFIRSGKGQRQAIKKSVIIEFERYPAHEKEFELRLLSSNSTNVLSITIKNLAYQSVQPDVLPATKKVDGVGIILKSFISRATSDGRQECVPAFQVSTDTPPGWKLLKPEIYSAYQVPGDLFPPCPHEPICILKVTAVTNLLELEQVISPNPGEVLDISSNVVRANIGVNHVYLVGKGTYEMTNGVISSASSHPASSEEMTATWREKHTNKAWNIMVLDDGPNLLFSPSQLTSNLQIYASYVDEKGLPRCLKSRPDGGIVFSIPRITDNLRRQNPVFPLESSKNYPVVIQISSSAEKGVEYFIKNPLHGKD